MRVPFSLREYERLPDGTVVLRRVIGRSPFMRVNGEMLRHLRYKAGRQGPTVQILNETFRILQYPVLGVNFTGSDEAIVMKDGMIARFLAWYYRHLPDWLSAIWKREKRFWPWLKSGERFPWYVVTGWLARTFITL